MRQSQKRLFKSIQKIFFPLSAFFVLTGVSAASEVFYSVQTATYNPAAMGYAKKHFAALNTMLNSDEQSHLRIEQAGRYIVVRIGKFDSPAEAVGLLEKIKAVADDAFLVKISDLKGEHAASPGQKPVSGQDGVIKSKKTLEAYYTLQVKNFQGIEPAASEFNSLAGKLKGIDLEDLRIEKVNGQFSVRLGKFRDLSSAKAMLALAGDLMPSAAIIKGSSSTEHVVKTYVETSPPVIVLEHSGASAKKTGQAEENHGPDDEKQRKEMELLLRDISTQYSDNKFGKAAELLKKGIQQWPDNPDLHAWYGATLLNMKYPENALQQYRKAVEISPDVPDYHAGVGISLVNIYMERARESIDAFNRALQIDPNNVTALEGLGFVYASIGKKDLAVEIYNRLVPINKSAALRLYQAITNEINWEAK